MTHEHSPQPHRDRSPWSELPAGFADHLDVEAALSAPVTRAALEEVASALDTEPSSIIDLGSGTGAGTVALASRFPNATIHAVDVSPGLLDRLRAAAAAAGVADRVEAHLADLDGDWAALLPDGVGLVWAGLSLHHVAVPARVLRQAFEVLRPGGVLAVTETTGTPTLEPADLGSGRDGLSHRLAAARPNGGYVATADWPAMLDETGFAFVRHREPRFTVSARTDDGARYLATRLRSQREHLAGALADEDLAGLDAAVAALEAGTSELSATAGRAIWVASRPGSAAGRERIETDVVVVGGGAAGLAAAVALARSRRDVVVVDAGQPRNAPAEGAHNVLGHEGISPLDLLDRGRAEAESYGVRIIRGRATGAAGRIDDFAVDVDDGAHQVRARRIILATGLVDELPAIPGVAQAWGHAVLHCPFCHGWEVRDQRISILTGVEVAVHQAMLFRALSDQVTLFLHEADDPTEEQWEQLAALEVSVVRPRVERLVVDGSQVRAVEIEGGKTFGTDAVGVAPRFNARTELYEALEGQAETTPFGQQIPADPRGMTPVPGVWATGNAAQPMAMVVGAAASGVVAGAAVHGDLSFADMAQAVRARRGEELPA